MLPNLPSTMLKKKNELPLQEAGKEWQRFKIGQTDLVCGSVIGVRRSDLFYCANLLILSSVLSTKFYNSYNFPHFPALHLKTRTELLDLPVVKSEHMNW